MYRIEDKLLNMENVYPDYWVVTMGFYKEQYWDR